MRQSPFAVLLVLAALVVGTAPSFAGIITIGDNDGYGLGVPDNHSGAPFWPGPGGSGTNYDGRSPAEAAATNGAQVTDVYSALFPGFGPNPTNTVSLVFPFSGQLVSGTFTIDVADLQLQPGGLLVDFNGVPQPGLLPNQGFRVSNVFSFALTPAQLANANLAGQFVVNMSRQPPGSGDFIAFDYFQFVFEVPEPATLALCGLVGLGLAGYRLRRRIVAGC